MVNKTKYKMNILPNVFKEVLSSVGHFSKGEQVWETLRVVQETSWGSALLAIAHY